MALEALSAASTLAATAPQSSLGFSTSDSSMFAENLILGGAGVAGGEGGTGRQGAASLTGTPSGGSLVTDALAAGRGMVGASSSLSMHKTDSDSGVSESMGSEAFPRGTLAAESHTCLLDMHAALAPSASGQASPSLNKSLSRLSLLSLDIGTAAAGVAVGGGVAGEWGGLMGAGASAAAVSRLSVGNLIDLEGL